MSYEGSVEYLCMFGHYIRFGCHDDEPKECHFCKARVTHWHSIDHTNGQDESDPSTMPAPKQQIGYDDHWRADHYGNRYATKIPRYTPSSQWREKAGSSSSLRQGHQP